MVDRALYTRNPDIQAAFFDIDGTLTTGGEAWETLLESPDVKRLRKVWLYATALPHYLLSKTGAVSQTGFRDRWVRLMAWLMTGWSREQVAAVCERTVSNNLVPVLRPDMVDVLSAHKAQGHHVVLISTMFEEIVQGLAKHLDADAGLGSQVEMRGGYCAGRIEGPTCSGARKVDIARRHLERHLPELSPGVCAAYADSRSDIPFLAGMGYPVATYPDEAMRAVARERGWPIYPDS